MARAPAIRNVITSVTASAFSIPTDFPEADGTISWDATTLVLVEVTAGDVRGMGYTYADAATAAFITEHLAAVAVGQDAMATTRTWSAMVRSVRNLGESGVAAMAISAVDTALWDLKARLLDMPLFMLLGPVRTSVPVYGSGGFTSYTMDRLCAQLSGWVEAGITRVKMKVGMVPATDVARVQAARKAIGSSAELFVDANGAYSRKQALAMAERFRDFGVTWFEEPVPQKDVAGLRLLRDRAPAGMEIAAGEYGYTLDDFRRLLEAGAIDVLQADATRCGGITGFLRAAALGEAFHLPFSAHTAPSLHAHACCAIPNLRHVEYFHDHARIEDLFFDGVPALVAGELRPDPRRAGMGLELRRDTARSYLVYGSV